jgi:hypothetical protein
VAKSIYRRSRAKGGYDAKIYWRVIAMDFHPGAPVYLLGTCFYFLGEMFDKRLFVVSREYSYFFEKLCENAATYFLAPGAIWTAWTARRIPE